MNERPPVPRDGRERAVLVGIARSPSERDAASEHLEELSRLTDTAGGVVVAKVLKERARLEPSTFLGRGQAEDVAKEARDGAASVVIFDDDLSPGQMKNLEKVVPARILDRSGLILDIFARRAKSHEARTQVELAQLEYFLPRLTRRWTHLERQAGGIGTRGVGETQLELDRRLIKGRIAHLKRLLRSIALQRRQRRSGRSGLYKVAIVGYTNAGKSTLMRALTGADVFVEDRLFATLDAQVRRMPRARGKQAPGVVVIDTVGFLRKLPHALVASFRSTLEEVLDADLLLHVIDVSDPNFRDQAAVTMDVLGEIGAGDRRVVVVYNKIDRVADGGLLESLRREDPEALFASAATGAGVDGVRERIQVARESSFHVARIAVAQRAGDVLSAVRAELEIIDESYDGGVVHLKVRGRPEDIARLAGRAGRAAMEQNRP
ncbi:MAG: GTPase HflX [Acidobacteriota bacterium]